MDNAKEYLLVKVGSYDEEDTTFPDKAAAKKALALYKKKLLASDGSMKIETDTEDEVAVSCGEEYQEAWVTEKPDDFFSELQLLMAKAYTGLTQYAYELEDSSTCSSYLDKMQVLICRERAKKQEPKDGGVPVHIEYGGRAFELTQAEIDAAYAFKDTQYGMEDAKSQLNRLCFGDRNAEDIGETSPAEVAAAKSAFEETYGINFDTAMAHLDVIYGIFAQVQRNDLPDDESWEEAIHQSRDLIPKTV